MRGKDSHILYIGDVRFVDDARFELLRERSKNSIGLNGNLDNGRPHSLARGDWTLKVRFVEAADEGDFECQLSTSPKLSKTFRINVVGECKAHSFARVARPVSVLLIQHICPQRS